MKPSGLLPGAVMRRQEGSEESGDLRTTLRVVQPGARLPTSGGGMATTVERVRRTMAEVIEEQLDKPDVTIKDVQRLLLRHALGALEGVDEKPSALSMASLNTLATLTALQAQGNNGGGDEAVLKILTGRAEAPAPATDPDDYAEVEDDAP